MKIAVTWSTWFVWAYIVNFFSKANTILAFNRNIEGTEGNIKYKRWDIKDKYAWNLESTIFIHCAADTWYEKDKNEMIKSNVLVNKNVLDLVNNSNCKHFIFVSSSSVYQWISGEIKSSVKINENNLKNSYSLTKYLAEEYIKEHLKKDINLTILRPRAIYWEWDRVLVPNVLKNQIFWKLILPWDWKNKTSITEINDFITTINDVILNKKYWTYNSFTNISTYEELYTTIVSDYKLKWILKIPISIFKFLELFNKNKYSYIVDTFSNDKILK